MAAFQAGEQTLFYELHGPEHGVPVLLMHGYMQIGRELAILANALAGEGFRVILPDLPGYGRSVPPPRTFTPDFYQRDARKIGELLDGLGLKNVHVLGFSDGGEVALLMPILRPDLCRSTVAWGAIGAYSPALGAWVRDQMPRSLPTPSQRACHPGQPIGRWQEDWIAAFGAIVAAGGDVSLSRAGEIRCPLLIMVGDKDELNPVESMLAFVAAATHPGCMPKLHKVFAGVGHPIHEERIDEFLGVVLDFLRKV